MKVYQEKTAYCCHCKEYLPVERFNFHNNSKLKIRKPNTLCKPCSVKSAASYAHKYKEKVRAYKKEYCKINKDKNSERARNWKLKTEYGMTPEDYERMFEAQNRVCAICKKEEYKLDGQGKLQRLCVDHCHVTKKVRGLLCNLCNVALGSFKDNEENMLIAIEYLKKSRS